MCTVHLKHTVSKIVSREKDQTHWQNNGVSTQQNKLIDEEFFEFKIFMTWSQFQVFDQHIVTLHCVKKQRIHACSDV